MKQSNLPIKIDVVWGSGAGASYIREVPDASQIATNPGAASWTDGFVPLNLTAKASGGIPPAGQDMNGALRRVSGWVQYLTASAITPYDATFQSTIGGYPLGSLVGTATSTVLGRVWVSTVDGNTTNPDTGGAGWLYLTLPADVLALINANTPTIVNNIVAANFIISTAVQIQIGGTAPAASTTAYPNYFATLAAAFTWVSAYTITSTGAVTFNLSSGQTVIASAQVNLNHPNANRIFIAGAAMKGAVPVPNSFAASGNSAAARGTDRTTNIGGVRTLYGSEVNFPGGGGFVFGNGVGGITNVLITGDTSTGTGLGGDLITVQGGSVGLTGVTIGAGGGRGVLVTQNGSISATNSYVFGCLGGGWSVEEGGRFIGSLNIGSFGNGGSNVNVSGGGNFFMDQSAGSASVTSRCAGANGVNATNGDVNIGPAALIYGCANGVVASDGSFINANGSTSSANAGYGFYAVDGSTISCLGSSSTVNNGTYCYAAAVSSSIYLTGSGGNGNSGAATPAVNTVGNQNSYITQ